MKHTILGAGGSIGNALTDHLLATDQSVRLVSRSNYSVSGAESFQADLTSYEETLKSVKGSDVVHLCVGLPYHSKIWAEQWPLIMRNAIDVCKSTGARFIFFDNVYMYGKVDGKMTEETPYNPTSKKGELRAKIARMLEDEMKLNNIKAIIARAADLYGPYSTTTSMLYIMGFEKLLNGKKAQWLGHAEKSHSFSYTTDCAKAMYLLSTQKDCYQQVWHLPTYNPAPTGKEYIELIAKELGVKADYTVLKKWMVRMAGLFNRTIFEAAEMLYQSEFDYYFDSTKFNKHFNFQPTPYDQGIRETLSFLLTN